MVSLRSTNIQFLLRKQMNGLHCVSLVGLAFNDVLSERKGLFVMSLDRVRALSPGFKDSNTFDEKITVIHTLHCVCAHVLFQNDDRITTHSELCSRNSGPRQRMREQSNIFIRHEQAPLAKNEFVRLLDRPCCSDSARAEWD